MFKEIFSKKYDTILVFNSFVKQIRHSKVQSSGNCFDNITEGLLQIFQKYSSVKIIDSSHLALPVQTRTR